MTKEEKLEIGAILHEIVIAIEEGTINLKYVKQLIDEFTVPPPTNKQKTN